jgi:hypothetical protein
MNSAAVRLPVRFHLGAINNPAISAPKAIVHWIVTETHPYLYAIEPHATKVPAEKKLMNKDKPPINQGTASPPAKNDLIFRPVRANNIPMHTMKAEKMKMTSVSIVDFMF